MEDARKRWNNGKAVASLKGLSAQVRAHILRKIASVSRWSHTYVTHSYVPVAEKMVPRALLRIRINEACRFARKLLRMMGQISTQTPTK